jgi:hypothetical protein
MPVFGRLSRLRKSALGRDRGRYRGRQVIEAVRRGKKKVLIKPRDRWHGEKGTMREVEAGLKYPVMRHVAALEAANSKSGKQTVVVEWGCAEGKAITRLAMKFPKVRCFGVSKDYFVAWPNKKFRNLSLILTTKERLHRYFKFNNNYIDFVYSWWGLRHLNQGRDLLNFLISVHPKLKRGAKIVFDVDKTQRYDGVAWDDVLEQIPGYSARLEENIDATGRSQKDATSNRLILTKK